MKSLKVDFRSETVVKVEEFPRAKKTAYKVWVVGTKNIGGFVSELLLVGFPDENKSVCLVTVDPEVSNGE